MAFNFVSASSQYLEITSGVVTAAPVTMACWYQPVSAAVAYSFMSLGVTGSALNRFRILQPNTGEVNATTTDGAASSTAASTASGTAGVWQHACGVFASATSRAAYLNGANKGTNATSRTPSGINDFLIGSTYTGASRGAFMNGNIAEAAIWNVALTDADVASLAAGFSPKLIRPEGLVAYWPLIGMFNPAIDVHARNELTVTGATAIAHVAIRQSL